LVKKPVKIKTVGAQASQLHPTEVGVNEVPVAPPNNEESCKLVKDLLISSVSPFVYFEYFVVSTAFSPVN